MNLDFQQHLKPRPDISNLHSKYFFRIFYLTTISFQQKNRYDTNMENLDDFMNAKFIMNTDTDYPRQKCICKEMWVPLYVLLFCFCSIVKQLYVK